MNIDFYTYSGVGGRPVNEDSLIFGEGYYVVSDGLGGHVNGEIASSAAVRHIADNYRSDISAETVAELLVGADEAVRRYGEGGKATIAALFTDNDKIRISNVGDSRVYYFRQGSIFFRTRDHSVCQLAVDMGQMTDDEVRHSPDRSGLLKVLGEAEPVKLPKPYDLIDPQDGDAFLICSDGFWEHVYDQEMIDDLLASKNAREWLELMLKRQLLRAEDKDDNYTAICGVIHISDDQPKTASSESASPGAMAVSGNGGATQKTGSKKMIIACAVGAAVVVAAGILAAVLFSKGSSSGEQPGGSDAPSMYDASSAASETAASDDPAASDEQDLSETGSES